MLVINNTIVNFAQVTHATIESQIVTVYFTSKSSQRFRYANEETARNVFMAINNVIDMQTVALSNYLQKSQPEEGKNEPGKPVS